MVYVISSSTLLCFEGSTVSVKIYMVCTIVHPFKYVILTEEKAKTHNDSLKLLPKVLETQYLRPCNASFYMAKLRGVSALSFNGLCLVTCKKENGKCHHHLVSSNVVQL
jgi:hypothetical protein